MIMFENDSGIFHNQVDKANQRFKELAVNSGGNVEPFLHPLIDPNGTKIHTSVAWLGAKDAKTVLLIVSGTHGNEGWAGSAIQIDSLQRGVFNSLPDNTAVMMIHLINPWGCAWGRRENEDNADLFRDLIYYKPELYSTDIRFTDDLAAALSLTDYSPESRSHSETLTEDFIRTNGEAELINIMRAGQFRYPEAPCYNGGGISWSFRLYKDLVQRYLSQARQVFCIDIHTAFGEYGDGILIPYYKPDGPDKAKFDYLQKTYGSEKLYVGGFDPGIPSHPRMPYEIATDFVPGLEMIATGLEFGTYDWDDAINLIKYMNYLFTKGDPLNPERPDLVEQYNKLCYPDKDDWREMVITRGREVINQTLAGMANWTINK